MTTEAAEYATQPADPGTLAGRRAERRADRLLAEQIRRDREDARREGRQADQAAADARRQARRMERADARAAALQSAGAWAGAHSIDLMFVPVIAVPGWLGWDAMTNFGQALYGAPGGTLPLLSECAMWIFEFAIVRSRRQHPDAPVWGLYAGMTAFALICATLNFLHGLDGPIPGSVAPGVGAGVVYAVISVSGIIAHQIVSLAGGQRHAATTASRREAVATLAAGLAGAVGGDAAVKLAESAGGDATKVAARLAADLADVTADRDRQAGKAASLAHRLAQAGNSLSGKGTAGNAGRDAKGGQDNPDGVVSSGRGSVKADMRKFWEDEVAAGRVPTGPDLNRAAGKPDDYSLGRKYASEWRPELPALAGDSPDDEATDGAAGPALQAVAV